MTAPDNPVPLKSVKPEEWPERLYGGKAVVRFPSGVESGNWYSKPDAGGDQTREYIRADVARADAQTAQVLVAERAAVMIEDNVRHAKELGREIWAMPDLRALAPAEALAEVQRLIAEAVAAAYEVTAKSIETHQLSLSKTSWASGNNSGVNACVRIIRDQAAAIQEGRA